MIPLWVFIICLIIALFIGLFAGVAWSIWVATSYTEPESPFDEGWRMYNDIYREYSNPYAETDPKHKEWLEGFNAAAKHAIIQEELHERWLWRI